MSKYEFFEDGEKGGDGFNMYDSLNSPNFGEASWWNNPTTFGNMEGSEVWKIEQEREREREERVREEEERVREEEELKILYKFNIGDKIKVKKIAKIYKPQLDINIGEIGEILRILDYVNNKILFVKKKEDSSSSEEVEDLDKSTRNEVFCTDIDLFEEFPDGVRTEPGPGAPQIIYDVRFNITDNDNPAKNKWIDLYFSEDGIKNVVNGGKRKKRRKSLFKKSLFRKKSRSLPRTKRRKRKTRRKTRRKTKRKRRI